MLAAIITEPRGIARASVIWLHGLGASGDDFAAAVPSLGLPEPHGIRFIFPHAPKQPVTLNMGFEMPAWYDIYGLTHGTREDAVGLARAAGWIEALIAQEMARGIPSDKIVLAGFSQGGALALYTAVRASVPLAGVIALSTYLPLAQELPESGSAANQQLPIWMAHGTDDRVVGLSLGTYSRDALKACGYPIEWQTYPIAHTVCPEELLQVGQWLLGRLK